MAAGTEVDARTMLPCAVTCTVPPLKDCGEVPLALALGTTTMTTVAVEPDCSEPRLQLTTKFVVAPPHVPVLAVADTNVSGMPVTAGLKLSVTAMLFARSGPLFVIV